MPLHDWQSIEGWLSEEEGRVLAALATNHVVLELGSYKGRSTLCMAQTASIIFAVDRHVGDSSIGPRDTLGKFLNNLRRAKAANVVPVVGDIEALAPRLRLGTFGMVFIDGDHEGEAPKRDTNTAMELVYPGGIIAWHDIDRRPVQLAIDLALRVFGPDGFRRCETLGWITTPPTKD